MAAKDAASNAPPDAASNAPPDAAGNTPPQDSAKNIPPSQNATRNASSSKKHKLSRDAEPGGKLKDGTLPDLDQSAKENNPITRDEDNKENSTLTISFRSYGRRYGRR